MNICMIKLTQKEKKSSVAVESFIEADKQLLNLSPYGSPGFC